MPAGFRRFLLALVEVHDIEDVGSAGNGAIYREFVEAVVFDRRADMCVEREFLFERLAEVEHYVAVGLSFFAAGFGIFTFLLFSSSVGFDVAYSFSVYKLLVLSTRIRPATFIQSVIL